jgi:hypothetical protein
MRLNQRRRNTMLRTSLSALTRAFRYIAVAHPEEKKHFSGNIPISTHQNIQVHCSGSPRGEETLCWEHTYQHSPEHSGTLEWLTQRRRNTLLGTPLSALTRTFRYIEETHPEVKKHMGTSLSALTRTFRYIEQAHPEDRKHFAGNIPIRTHQSIQVHCRGSPRGKETICLEHPYQHSPEHSGILKWLTLRRRNTLLGTSLSALIRTFMYNAVAHP